MIYKKKLLSAVLAATTVMGLAVPAMAADPTANEIEANADTTIAIFNTTVDPTNVSFEVPLYVTLAAVTNKPDVVVPDNYGITNTSDGGDVPNGIGVTAMSFSKLTGSTFNTTQDSTVASLTDIRLSIGNVLMPVMNAPGTKAVDFTKKDNTGGEVAFITSNKPTKIDAGKTLELPIKGLVQNAARSDQNAVAQFKVTYVISALNAAGDPIGAIYAGNDSEAAGLGKWNDMTATWE